MDFEEKQPSEPVPAFDPNKWGPVPQEPSKDRKKVVFALIAFFAFCFFYRLIIQNGFGRTGLMFVGLPAIVAVLLGMAPPAKSTTGAIAKGITFVLLVLAPLMGEGYLCILIASPLFYLVGVVIGISVDALGKRGNSRGNTLGCMALVIVPMCLEGISPYSTLPRAQVVEARRIIHAPASAVTQSLSGNMQIRRPLPRFLRIGFPRPVLSWGEGLHIGDERGLHFTGAEGTPPGDLRLRVAESRDGYVRMQTVTDDSKVTEWLNWRDTEVAWKPIDATHTEVTARVHFDRGLDPAWYFTAWERFAARQAAEYLITSNATPNGIQ